MQSENCIKRPNENSLFSVDKNEGLCLNVTKPLKTLTENLFFPEPDPESRRVVRAGTAGKDDLVPELVL